MACSLLGLWVFFVQITVTDSKLLPWAPASHMKNERARWEELQGPCKHYRCDIYEMKSLEMVVMVAESRNSCLK